jgi:CIC family chloride channel protein
MLKIAQFIKQHFLEIDIGYLRKWLLIGGLIGVVAGLGSIVFAMAINWATHLFLGQGAGLYPPLPVGEGQTVVTEIGRRWMIPLVTTLGGLISGLIVYKLAPEAEGHGTDAAIDAFHNKEGLIRARIPLVKLVASAITIGSGGSAGREGPTAQIAAGFGSLLGRVLKLSVRERRIAVAAGIGAGIGSIFRAPLGGALLSIEVLYLEGFEIEALIPSFIASIIGYTIFASWSGYNPIFGTHYEITFQGAYSLIYYAGLGLICGLVGILYPWCFYGVRNLFRRLRIPNYFKPAIGGLAVGLLGLALPQVLGMGYGWLQIVMTPQTIIPLGLMAILVFAKIVATSLSIGSGGSGGVFAPGLFIGGMLGAIVWAILNRFVPNMPPTPEPFVVVGMMALFGGVARAPLAVMFMVGEMAGSYTMLAPAMIAVGISYIIVGHHTIYESQVESPASSPAHRYEYSFPLLQQLKVKDAMNSKVITVWAKTSALQALQLLQTEHIKSLPVVNHSGDNHIVGIVTVRDILRIGVRARRRTPVDHIMTTDLITIGPEKSLNEALELLTQHDIASLPVVSDREKSKLLGMITRNDVSRSYTSVARRALKQPQLGTVQQAEKQSEGQ